MVEKEKWTNKRTDEHYVVDSLIHSISCHYQTLYQVKILSQVDVVSEILTENCFT